MAIFTKSLELPPNLLTLKESLHKHWAWHFALGLILMVLGTLNISYSVWTTFISVIFFGYLLIIASIATIFHAARFWQKRWRDFYLHLLISLAYGVTGLLMVINPMLGAVSLTLTLCILYLILGGTWIVIAITQHLPGWSWMLFNGIVDLILGGLIWFYWPINSLWVIGILLGIDIIFMGWWLTILGWSARKEGFHTQ